MIDSKKKQELFYLNLIPTLSYDLLQLIKPQLFDFVKSQKNDDFFLKIIRSRGVFSNIPIGSDSTKILERLLFVDNPGLKKISRGEAPTSVEVMEPIFWFGFYSELRLEREK